MKKLTWIMVGMIAGLAIGIALMLLCRPLVKRLEEKREAAEVAEALEQGFVLSNYEGWPVREDVILTTEYEAYPVGTWAVYGLLENQSDDSILVGAGGSTSLERYIAGDWYRIPAESRAHVATGTQIESGGEMIVADSTSFYEYDFPEGRYRLVVRYLHGPAWASSRNGRDPVAFAEFEIQNNVSYPKYGNIRLQRFREKRAMESGCLVFRDGVYQNAEQLEISIKRTVRGAIGKLRIVDLDQKVITDVINGLDDENKKWTHTITTYQKGKVTTETVEEIWQWEGQKELQAIFTEEE